MENKDYVSLETARLLEEVGYDGSSYGALLIKDNGEPCKGLDREGIWMPLLYFAAKWLREEHQIDITIYRSFSMTNSYHYCIVINCDYDNEELQDCTQGRTYEQALDLAIAEACKLIKK